MERVADHSGAWWVRHAGIWLLFLLAGAPRLAAQDLLERRVTIHGGQVRLARALELLAKDGHFKLSYNTEVVPVDSLVDLDMEDRTVERVLGDLLPAGLRWKASGQHLIITGASGAKQRFLSHGRVVEAGIGVAIPRASVLEVQRGNVVASAADGSFSIHLTGDLELTPVRIARAGFRDTVVQVMRAADIGRIALSPLPRLERMEPICQFDRCGVEDLGVARLLVPADRLDLTANLGGGGRRPFQFSVLPSVSTNGPLAASTVNHASVNLFGGYARGVDGEEFAGVFNLISEEMKGFQFGGVANLVGGRTRGMQFAGAMNHTMGSLHGLQLAGLSNTVWDTLSGAQVAGGVNIVKRGMSGTQVSGAANITLGDLDGVQVSGGVNVAHGAVRKSQWSGALNYARSVTGGQVTAGANVSLGDVGGGQVGFGANYARSVSGGQVSFGANIVPGEVSGGQVGFGLNYAHQVTGGQFSFGANVVPGRVEAGQVGFGLNYAHHVTEGQFSFGANIVPGEVHGGQVGFGLNYAHHVTKGQFSFGANIVPGRVEGAQVGVFNFAVGALGGQIGIVNISDTVGGAAVGLLTIARKGYHRADMVANDVMPVGVQLRTGTHAFHNIIGYSPALTSNGRWGILYGFGTEPRLGDRWTLNIDLTGEQLVEQEQWVDAVNIVGRLSIAAGIHLGDRLHVSAGPVLNTLVSDLRDADTGAYSSTLPPGTPLFTGSLDRAQVVGWLGWRAGVGVRF